MDFSTISTIWAALNQQSKMLIVTEPKRRALAERIRVDNLPFVSEIRIAEAEGFRQDELSCLGENDLLLVLLTVEGFMDKGYRDIFPSFSKPDNLAGKYIFIRLDIPEESLLTGVNTSPDNVESIIRECRAFSRGKTVRVVTGKGTDITMKIAGQEFLPYRIIGPGGSAFLPPSEISEELEPGSANGVIVADITVGEIRFGPELIDPLGIVDRPVTITVENGLVTKITGGEIGQRLKAGLDRLDKSLQILVELGHGLSDLAPTGIIGVDESMNGTCHFGIGNRNPYHVDVVVSEPVITILAQNEE